MKKLFLIICFLSFAQVVFANDGVKLDAEQRVIELPPNQWYLTIFGEPSDPKFQLLKHWIDTHPGLANLKSQVHFNIYTTDNVRFKRYEPTLPGKVCIRLQNSAGVVTAEFWDEYIPISAEGLYQGIRADISDKASWGCLRRRRCRPKPQPQPTPEPEPFVEPIIKPVDTPPVLPKEPESSFPWLLAVVSALAGAGIGIAQGYKDEYANTTLA